MTARQLSLIEPPKRKPRVMAHVCDAGDSGCTDGAGVQYKCGKCGWLSGWITGRTVTEHRSGWPCPRCNA